ncbi:hypothetical protein L0F63_003401 [Massospora cicadina]|nr:hypothetical protein L0F63_003401 [Massospora cicadina]
MLNLAALGLASRAREPARFKHLVVIKRGAKQLKATPVALPHRAPQTFLQTVILTTGATLKLRTTSPKGVLVLTKDTHNHKLWNPRLVGESDFTNDQLAKFSAKYADLDDFGLEDEVGQNVFDNMGEASAALQITSKDLTFLSEKEKNYATYFS